MNKEISFPDGTKQFVFNQTLSALQGIDVGNSQFMPRLSDVFELLGDCMIINVEVKTPYEEAYKSLYNYKKAS